MNKRMLTNEQILGRLKAEFRGYQVETTDRGKKFRITAPHGKQVTDSFEEIRDPVQLQAAIASIRKRLS